VPSSACEPNLAVVPFSSSSDISSDTNSDDEHPPPPASPPALAPPTTSQFPQWVCSTCESAGDPRDQRWTRSQFQRASSLLAQVSDNYDHDTFA
jgi:hypothetical protein